MDYSEFDQKYSGAGHPAYHPRINLQLLMLAHVDSMRSSRRIAKNSQENVVYIYLAEKTQPDFRTISSFRKDNPKLIIQASLQLKKFAYENGLIDLSHLMIDGTSIKANANNNRILDKATIKKLKKHIDREIQRGIQIDEEEDKIYGD
jgi:transposase